MKIQKQLSKQRGDKKYYRFTINILEDSLKEAGLREDEELIAESKKGEIKLKKK